MCHIICYSYMLSLFIHPNRPDPSSTYAQQENGSGKLMAAPIPSLHRRRRHHHSEHLLLTNICTCDAPILPPPNTNLLANALDPAECLLFARTRWRRTSFRFILISPRVGWCFLSSASHIRCLLFFHLFVRSARFSCSIGPSNVTIKHVCIVMFFLSTKTSWICVPKWGPGSIVAIVWDTWRREMCFTGDWKKNINVKYTSLEV